MKSLRRKRTEEAGKNSEKRNLRGRARREVAKPVSLLEGSEVLGEKKARGKGEKV